MYFLWLIIATWAVIFNLYGPRAVDDDNERLRFKLIFFMMLQVLCFTPLSGVRV